MTPWPSVSANPIALPISCRTVLSTSMRPGAGLWVARRAALRLPRGVALHHQAELAERLAVACRIAAVVDANPLVGAVALRKLVQEGDLRGLRHASDRGEAELGERHDEAVEL